MFGVIACSRCHRAKGVDLSKKTTTCSCGSEIRVRSARVYARADTERDLVEAVGLVQAQLGGGLAAYRRAASQQRPRRSPSVHARVAEGAKTAGDRAHQVRAAAKGLTDEIEVFTFDDLRRVLDALGIPGSHARLRELLDSNIVYEPRTGYYRAVDPSA